MARYREHGYVPNTRKSFNFWINQATTGSSSGIPYQVVR